MNPKLKERIKKLIVPMLLNALLVYIAKKIRGRKK